jgi:uncharacterized membrane protein
MSYIKRLLKECFTLGFTLAGTGLVLITLSSSLLRQGIIISIAGLVLHLIGTAIDHRSMTKDE